MKKIAIYAFLSGLFLILGGKASAGTLYDYVVAQDGSGDFRTVQEAVNASPDYCKQAATTIYIKKGIYREKLTIPKNKQKLHLVGEDRDSTIISWNDYALKEGPTGHSLGTSATSTLFLYADDFLCENLTIENTSGSGPEIAQACALTVDADRVAFINCRFLGNQDTLYTYGKYQHQYYKDCYIEGTTDFIFGASTCWFENCTIHSKLNSYVTAASTPQDCNFGYVFHNCRLTASDEADKVYLGRPWRPYAKTVFIDCELGGHIRPEGWHDWNKQYAHETSYYAEYNSSGAGASPQSRVAWSHQLSQDELADYTPAKVLYAGSEIDKNGVDLPVGWFFHPFDDSLEPSDSTTDAPADSTADKSSESTTAPPTDNEAKAISDSVYFANRNYRAIDMYRPCYLISGLPVDRKPTAENCDVKFQASLKFNLWQNIADKYWDIFFSYTQVSIWSLYAQSSPFYDTIYAPGVHVYRPLIKADKLFAALQFGFEHQSNGRDDDGSRSFNYLYFTYVHYLGNFSLQAKLRGGFGYVEEDIRDMHQFYGYGHIAATYHSPDKLFCASLLANPCDYFKKCNITAEAFIRLGKDPRLPYFFIQYSYGLETPRQFLPQGWKPASMLRFGIAIRPNMVDIL